MSTAAESVAMRTALNKLLCERRTVHDFRPEPVPDELLECALDAARWAPNHHRTEPWRFYLLGERVQRAVAELNAAAVSTARGARAAEVKLARWLAVPHWLVLTSRIDGDALRVREDYAACCCAAENMMLSMWAAGVGMKWTTGAVVRDAAFAGLVGFDPDVEQVVGLFWYGWPAQIIEQQRRPLSQIMRRVE